MVENGVAYPDYDIRSVKLGNGLAALTATDCAALCKDDDDCKFWILSMEHSQCNLKTSDKNRESRNTAISGLKPCN